MSTIVGQMELGRFPSNVVISKHGAGISALRRANDAQGRLFLTFRQLKNNCGANPDTADHRIKHLSPSLITDGSSRRCNLCNLTKPLDDFYPHKACKAGRAPQCKACVSARAKRKYEANPEAARAAGRNDYARHRQSRKAKVACYRQANPEKAALAVKRAEQKKPEKYAALHQAWAERNREKTRAATRKHCAKFADREAARQRAKSTAFRLANPTIVAQRYKAWAEKNPLSRRIIHHRRRAAKLRAAGSYTRADIERIFANQAHRCNSCHLIKPLEIDHIVPLQPRPGEPAGSNEPSNLQGLCRMCNIRKRNIPWDIFLLRTRASG